VETVELHTMQIRKPGFARSHVRNEDSDHHYVSYPQVLVLLSDVLLGKISFDYLFKNTQRFGNSPRFRHQVKLYNIITYVRWKRAIFVHVHN
jgi:hypothetical protein